MTSSPKRPWFRFHLLTAVMMMVAAGGFVSFNFNKRHFSYSDGHSEIEWMTTGWPFEVQRHRLIYGTSVWRVSTAIEELDRSWVDFSSTALVADIGVGILILFGVAFVSESILRRREGRKP